MNMKTIAGLFVALLFVSSLQVNANSIANDAVIAPPVNDDCANATELTVNTNFLCGTKTSGTLVDATASTAPSGCTGTNPALPDEYKAGDDVWFKFIATATSHKISLSITGGSPTDLYLMVYNGGVTGDCSTMSAIFCSDPETPTVSSLTIGNTYFIRVFSNSTASGATTTFDVCIGTEPTLISNDECDNIEAITTLPFDRSYDATSATNSDFVTAGGCIDLNDGVWFSVLGDGGNITLTVRPSGWDAGIGVYTGACNALTCVDSKNIGGNSVVESLTFASTVGVTYMINIGHPSGSETGATGVFELSVNTSTLSIDKLVLKGFKYYPNPVNDLLKMSANEAIDEVTVYSVLGKEVRKVRQGELTTEIDLSNLSTGTYFVKAVIGNSTGTFKILKN
ncbi:T9SS type A sorting domain-containing protein [Flavobacteriaceae bacterium F08102]|nr:T9SS type A sorting domain-containing protein [Flavobacteriaceae bacterium F08102]